MMTLYGQRSRETGLISGHLAVALNSARPCQGPLKSQQWKIGRTEVVTLMWASSWINGQVTYLQCRGCRREVLAYGVGHPQGYLWLAGVLIWVCEGWWSWKLGLLEIASLSLWWLPLTGNLCVGIWKGTKVLCLVLFQDTALPCASSPPAAQYFM